MTGKVIGVTVETDGLSPEQLESAKIFAGKNAGFCYQKESYFDAEVSGDDKAGKRFPRVAGTGHHSIADHIRVEVCFEGISKMLAIVLNSLQDYSTSEKSGRYTVMTGNSEVEQALYDKWLGLFKEAILKEEDIDDTLATKLAQENARYILSVFTRSTSMGYSTSLRQWNYILDWCKRYEERIINMRESGIATSFFEDELLRDLNEVACFIEDCIYVEELRDTKKRCFSFLTDLACTEGHFMQYFEDTDCKFSDFYQTRYQASFVHIAQAERHRTLKYFMQFNPDPSSFEFFIPHFIRGTELENEWLSDLDLIRPLVPQATLVNIVEGGCIDDFFLKCKERLCGRAQIEIMKQTTDTLMRFVQHGDLSKGAYMQLQSYARNGVVCTKCQILGQCKEPCRYVKNKHSALSRRI